MAVHYKYIKKIKDTGFDSTVAALLDGLTATSTQLNKAAVDGLDISVETVIDCSADETAETSAVCTVPAGSIIKDVIAIVSVAFDGDATTTFEVGVAGNTDAYIDPSDFDPSGTANTTYMSIAGGTNQDIKAPQWVVAATPIIATWTNTAATTAGSITVRVTYTDL